MKLFLKSSQKEICSSIAAANSFGTRLKGLIGTKDLQNSGLFIPRCNWVHTFFMSMTIDVIYVDKEGVIQKIDSHLAPWKLPPPVLAAHDVYEMPAGFAEQHQIKEGDALYVGH